MSNWIKNLYIYIDWTKIFRVKKNGKKIRKKWEFLVGIGLKMCFFSNRFEKKLVLDKFIDRDKKIRKK